MFYLVQYNDDPEYETFHADDYAHAIEQAKDSTANFEHYTISAVFQCIELDDAGQAIFPHEADRLCSHDG